MGQVKVQQESYIAQQFRRIHMAQDNTQPYQGTEGACAGKESCIPPFFLPGGPVNIYQKKRKQNDAGGIRQHFQGHADTCGKDQPGSVRLFPVPQQIAMHQTQHGQSEEP